MNSVTQGVSMLSGFSSDKESEILLDFDPALNQ